MQLLQNTLFIICSECMLGAGGFKAYRMMFCRVLFMPGELPGFMPSGKGAPSLSPRPSSIPSSTRSDTVREALSA